MQITLDFGRLTKFRSTLAIGAMMVAGAVGSALAVSPTVNPPIQWAGGVEFDPRLYTAGRYPLHAVPAGRNFLLTDLIVSNLNTTNDSQLALFTSNAPDCSTILKHRLAFVHVQTRATLNFPLVTGIGFTGGQHVCIEVFGGGLAVNGRGFLFTPAPS